MLHQHDIETLIDLAHQIAEPSEEIVILAEGNVSCRLDEHRLAVKASGHSLRGLSDRGVATVRIEPLLQALNAGDLDDSEVRDLLILSAESGSPHPSTESFFHAFLLSLPGVRFVAHGHPTALVALLSLQGCEEMARTRLFPDEVVCCGPATAFVPYADPGLRLARQIRTAAQRYSDVHQDSPKTYWMQNHGGIAVGATAEEALTGMKMMVKAARIRLAALQTGLPILPMPADQIERIQSRPDEHFRQQLLWALSQKPKA